MLACGVTRHSHCVRFALEWDGWGSVVVLFQDDTHTFNPGGFSFLWARILLSLAPAGTNHGRAAWGKPSKFTLQYNNKNWLSSLRSLKYINKLIQNFPESKKIHADTHYTNPAIQPPLAQ